MKKTLSCLLILSVFAAGTSFLPGEETVTDPVGGVNYTFAPGSQTCMGVPILRPPRRLDVITNGILTAATLANATDLSQDLPAGMPCYLEIIGPSGSGSTANLGARFEIDVTTTRLMANNIVAVLPESPHSTPGRTLADCVGCPVAIRPHWTLAALFGTGPSAAGLQSGTTIKTADQVHFWTGRGVSAYWFRSNGSGTVKEWRNAAKGALNQDGTIIPPGVGVIFQRSGATPYTLAAYGDVRTTRFLQPVGSGRNLIAPGFPVDMSPELLNFGSGAGFTGASTSASADQIQVGIDSSAPVYWYYQDLAAPAGQWRSAAGGSTDHSATPFLHPLRSFFVKTATHVAPVPNERPFAN